MKFFKSRNAKCSMARHCDKGFRKYLSQNEVFVIYNPR